MTKPTEKSVLHCGACGKTFADDAMSELLAHIETCPEARLGLNLISREMLFRSIPGRIVKRFHNLFEFLRVINSIQTEIEQYCNMVCLGTVSYEDRSSLHKLICQRLNFNYELFQPFENTGIFELPGLNEAKEIFYQGIADYLNIYYAKIIEEECQPKFGLTAKCIMKKILYNT